MFTENIQQPLPFVSVGEVSLRLHLFLSGGLLLTETNDLNLGRSRSFTIRSGAGEHTLDNGSDGVSGLPEGQRNTNDKGGKTPSHRDSNPESEVSLGEDTSGESKQRPQHNKHSGESPAGPLHPDGSLVHSFGRILSGELGLVSAIFFNESNLSGCLPVIVLRLHDRHDNADKGRDEDSGQVTAKHGVVTAKSVDGDGASIGLGSYEPDNETSSEARNSTSHGTSSASLGPGQACIDREHSTTNGDTHEQVYPAKGETDLKENNSEDTHEATETNDTVARNTDNVLASCLGVDVGAVNVIGDQRGHSDQLRVGSRGDSHEHKDANEPSTTGSHEVDSSGRRDQTGTGLSRVNGETSGTRAETERGGKGEGDAEPHKTTEDITLPGSRGLGSNGTHVVRLVNEHGTKVTDNVNDTEDKTTLREHGEERTTLVVGYGAELHVGRTIRGHSALDEGVKILPDLGRRSKDTIIRGIDGEREDNDSDEDVERVGAMGNEGTLEATKSAVHDDTDGDEDASSIGVHASESVHDGSTTKQKHSSHNDVGQNCEHKEDLVGSVTPASADDLKEGMSIGSFALNLNSEDTEENNLDGGTGSIPEGAGDTILPCDVGGL